MFELMAINFLRPWWFVALLPIIWIIWRAWQANKKQGAWHQVIEPKFRRLLLGDNSTEAATINEKIAYLGLATAWFLTVFALAGPWVKSVDVPAQKSQQGIVIVLDLSLSMLADDVTPNRLARVKYGLTDLVKQNPDYAIGMVAYAGSAHTITPISEDNKTLLSMLPSLNPVLMPKFGSEPILAMEKAHELLKGAKVFQGHIIWITDDIEPAQTSIMQRWIDSHNHSISLLTLGSKDGGVVQIPSYGLLKDDNGNLILPKVPLDRFDKLESSTNIDWYHFQIGTDYSDKLLPPKLSTSQKQSLDSEKDVDHPLDIGIYLLFLLIPLAAFIFRRGVLLGLLGFSVLPLGLLTPQDSFADSLNTDVSEMFLTHDQLGYQAWQAKDYETAENLFKHQQWRASALYRQGKYADAARLFELDKSANGYYNFGNALAKNMQLDEAIKAYEKSLLLDPELQAAKANLELVNRLKSISSSDESLQDQIDPESDKPSTAANNNTETSDETDTSADQGSELTQEQQQKTESSDALQTDNLEDSSSAMGSDSNNQKPAQNRENNPQTGDSQQSAPTATADSSSPSSEQTDNKDPNQQQEPTDESVIGESSSGSNEDFKSDQENSDQIGANRLVDGEEQLQPKSELTEQEQAQKNWLKQIPDQPGLFLKKKFEYQYQQNPRANKSNQKQW
jgi:Ca-activated chloride channel family protein